MKYIKLFETFISEGIHLTYNQVTPGDFERFVQAYKELSPLNAVIQDKANDRIIGIAKGNKTQDWSYDLETYRLNHSLKDRQVLGLINFKKMVSKDHPWAR